MASYLTTEELDSRMKPDLRERAEPTEKQTAISDASDEVDSYLAAAGYDLPLPNTPNNGAFKGHLAAIARYKLAVMLYLIPEPASQSQYYLDYKAALNFFSGLRTGETVLPITDADTSNDADALGGAPVIASKPARGWQ